MTDKQLEPLPSNWKDTAIMALSEMLGQKNNEFNELETEYYSSRKSRDKAYKARDDAWDEIDELKVLLRLVTQNMTKGPTTFEAIRKHLTEQKTLRVLHYLDEYDEIEANPYEECIEAAQ